MRDAASQIAENLRSIRRRIAAAAQRASREPGEIKLIAITKYVDADLATSLVAAGCEDVGESRPQELWRKAAALRTTPSGVTVRWHLVGHLQRNKVRRTLPLTYFIHSVDTLTLLDEINSQSAALSLANPVNVLLEINVSGDPAKHGFSPREIRAEIGHIPNLSSIRIRGLMAMAGIEGDLAAARRDFRALRELRDELRPACLPHITLDELSMGMSGDFEVAIEEGSTMVRIGSALFEGIDG